MSKKAVTCKLQIKGYAVYEHILPFTSTLHVLTAVFKREYYVTRSFNE